MNSGIAGAQRNLTAFKTGVLGIAGAATAAFAAVGTAATILVKNNADLAKEIEKMAVVADTSVEEIQALGYASDQVGIPIDKMADILKDVNDKLGDFTVAGAGGFVDFFEQVAPKVGITADQLSRLSSTEVLVAVKKAMEDANLPMKEQIFLLEAISNDSAALAPLLANNGKNLHTLIARFNELNVAMSKTDIARFKQMELEITDIEKKMSKVVADISLEISYGLLPLKKDIISVIDSMSEGVKEYVRQIKILGGARATLNTFLGISTKDLHTKAFEEYTSIRERMQKYEGVEPDSLLAFNPFGKSKNELKIFQHRLETSRKELEKINNQLVAEEKLKNFNFEDELKKNQPEAPTSSIDNQAKSLRSLSTYDTLYADERKKLLIASNQRIADIKKLTLTETKLKELGYASNAQLQQSYIAKEKAHLNTQLAELSKNEQQKRATLQAANDSTLSSLQSRYVTEADQLKVAHQNQLAEIANFQVSEKEAIRLGYESATAMKKELVAQENAFFKQQQADQLKQQQFQTDQQFASLQSSYVTDPIAELQRIHQQKLDEINNFNVSQQEIERLGFESLAALKESFYQKEAERHIAALQEQNSRDIAQKLEQKKRDEEEARQKEAIFNTRLNAVGGFLGQVSKLQDSENKKAQRVGKVAAKFQIMLQGYQAAVSAYNSLASIPYVGPALGAAAAGLAMGFAISTASKVDSLQGQAHDGMTRIPEDGTWNLAAGERVYTNESANQLDKMYQAIMSMHSKQQAINDPAYGYAKQLAAMPQTKNVVNIFGAPADARVEQSRDQNGDEVTNVFLSDLDSGGQMSQAISRTFGVARRGV